MALKAIVPFEHGLTWVQDEWMQRASHALRVDGRIWLIDPVDDEEPLQQAEALGDVAGVIQLLDRHPRACRALAERYDVPLHRLPDGPIPGCSLEVISVVRAKRWQERALWAPQSRTLVVAELVGTNDTFALSGNVGVHVLMRPATKISVGRDLPVAHLLVGHGLPVHDDAPQQLNDAYARRLTDLWRLPLALKAFRGGR